MNELNISDFLVKHDLPESYADKVREWFLPLSDKIAHEQSIRSDPIVIGINGAQGSGKSTLASLLVHLLAGQYQLSAITISLDDFYLSRNQRQQLASKVHPLFKTRGVPGTHDIDLGISVISALKNKQPIKIPRFNKAQDDLYPQQEWVDHDTELDVIIIEGWCLGVTPQESDALIEAINELEENEDADNSWRTYVNQQLADSYQTFFKLIDSWIMLKAPSFSCVRDWRFEQEQKLNKSIQKSNRIMDNKAITRFVQHYQRLTEHGLQTLPDRVNYLYELSESRDIVSFTFKK